LLGDFLEAIKKDFEKASKVYRSNCDDYNYANSCFKFGEYTFLGKGDPKLAYRYYEKGCDLSDSDSCLHSGFILVSKPFKEIERDLTKGFDFLAKSCKLNNGMHSVLFPIKNGINCCNF
jgi:cytochrome c oxidase assembly factor 7